MSLDMDIDRNILLRYSAPLSERIVEMSMDQFSSRSKNSVYMSVFYAREQHAHILRHHQETVQNIKKDHRRKLEISQISQ